MPNEIQLEHPPIDPILKYRNPEGDLKQYSAIEVTEKGTRDAAKFINEAVMNRNTLFDENFIKGIHRELFYFAPWLAGKYRPVSDHRISYPELENGQLVRRFKFLTEGGENIQKRMAHYGEWLKSEVERIKLMPEDLLVALHLATEAHYLFSSPDLHPFNDGNGRVSRMLMNSILMTNTHELMYYGIQVIPVPLLRNKITKEIKVNSKWEEDHYLTALRGVDVTGDLSDLEALIAEKWSANIDNMIKACLNPKTASRRHRGLTRVADKKLIDIFRQRKNTLDQFVMDHSKVQSHNSSRRQLPVVNLFKDENI